MRTSHLFATNNVVGVHITGADSEVDLNDSIIADPTAPGNGANANAGVGVLGEAGATAVLKGVALLRNRSGVVQQAGELTIADAVIAGSTGPALSAAGAANITETTLANNGGGASFTGSGKLDLSDLRVVDTRKLGSALTSALSIDGGAGTVARLVLARNDEYGVYVSGALTNLDFSDVRISDTRSVPDAGKAVHGIGFVVTDPAGAPTIGVTRGIIAQSREYGLANPALTFAATGFRNSAFRFLHRHARVSRARIRKLAQPKIRVADFCEHQIRIESVVGGGGSVARAGAREPHRIQ